LDPYFVASPLDLARVQYSTDRNPESSELVDESTSSGVALVSEARLKPNDLTLSDIGQNSSAGMPPHEHVAQR